MKHLYIIGNGFDIFTGLKTRYVDFMLWLEHNYPFVYENLVETYKIDGEWWNDFEMELGKLDVEFEQQGNIKAGYGKQLLTNLSKDLTRLRGKGYSRSNLFNMRLFYVRFPKIQTVSGQLTWSHYLELLKCDDSVEIVVLHEGEESRDGGESPKRTK